MRNRIDCKAGAGFDAALAAGYRISKADSPSRSLVALCDKLGDEYHLAMIDHGNVIHRVIGKGWDIEIFPRNSKSRYYCVVLWKGYGTESVAMEEDVKDDAVQNTVEMMLHLDVPEEVYPTRYDIGPRPHVDA